MIEENLKLENFASNNFSKICESFDRNKNNDEINLGNLSRNNKEHYNFENTLNKITNDFLQSIIYNLFSK